MSMRKIVGLAGSQPRWLLLYGMFLVVSAILVGMVHSQQTLREFAAVLNGPPPASGKQFLTLPPGATLPSDAECATRVRRTTWEPRPGNTSKNQYIPTKGSDYNIPLYNGSNLGIYLGDHPTRANALVNRTSGNFTGTTDEILQWAACKWGIDEDMARAQAVTESNWDMAAVGDNGESFGILQVRTTAHQGAFPAAQKSTAFNADYTYMRWRICYEGLVDYLGEGGTGYKSGDPWGCMGVWYTGNWYGSGGGSSASGAQAYIDAVKQKLSARTWESFTGVQITQSGGNQPTVTTIQTNPLPTTNSNQPTPTNLPAGTTSVLLNLLLHGIGKGGDNVNSGSGGTTNPLHPQRPVTIEIRSAANQLVANASGVVTLQSNGIFQGSVPLAQVNSGVYTATLAIPGYLRKTIPGILTINAGQTTVVTQISLVTGDTNRDNLLSILDYNILLDCFSDLSPAKNCSNADKKSAADITDDGAVNQFDYNLFLRELSVQPGS